MLVLIRFCVAPVKGAVYTDVTIGVGEWWVRPQLAMDEDENIDSYFLDIKEAYKQVLDGTIKDSKTMIAIQYAYQNLK